MAIAYRASTTNVITSGTSLSLNKPTGTVDGDVLVCCIFVNGSETAPTAPAGWTLQITQANTPDAAYVYWKAASGEGTSWAWTVPTAPASGICRCYSGVDNAQPVNVDGHSISSLLSPVNCATITTTLADTMAVFFWTVTDSSTNTGAFTYGGTGGPSNTVTQTSTSAAQICSCDDARPTAGTIVSSAYTISATDTLANVTRMTVALREPQNGLNAFFFGSNF